MEGNFFPRPTAFRFADQAHIQYLLDWLNTQTQIALAEICASLCVWTEQGDRYIHIWSVVIPQRQVVVKASRIDLNDRIPHDDAAFQGHQCQCRRVERVGDEYGGRISRLVGSCISRQAQALVGQVGPNPRALAAHPDQDLGCRAITRYI